jgi:hypothetical protein
MPIAGNKSADRARAHLRWAERYSKYGDVHKATSHFGRALDYTKSGFGTGGDGDARLGELSLYKKTKHSSFYEASLGTASVVIQIRPNEKGWVDVFVDHEPNMLSLKNRRVGRRPISRCT